MAVAVLIVNGGVGGDVAAPIARQVLEAALARMTPPRAVVLDMEGVLHVDWQAIDGSAAAVERLAGAGVGIAVLTNTTGRTRADIAERLAGMGMPIPAGRIVTAASAAGRAPAPPPRRGARPRARRAGRWPWSSRASTWSRIRHRRT